MFRGIDEQIFIPQIRFDLHPVWIMSGISVYHRIVAGSGHSSYHGYNFSLFWTIFQETTDPEDMVFSDYPANGDSCMHIDFYSV
jgi:hypothetical protein